MNTCVGYYPTTLLHKQLGVLMCDDCRGSACRHKCPAGQAEEGRMKKKAGKIENKGARGREEWLRWWSQLEHLQRGHVSLTFFSADRQSDGGLVHAALACHWLRASGCCCCYWWARARTHTHTWRVRVTVTNCRHSSLDRRKYYVAFVQKADDGHRALTSVKRDTVKEVKGFFFTGAAAPNACRRCHFPNVTAQRRTATFPSINENNSWAVASESFR